MGDKPSRLEAVFPSKGINRVGFGVSTRAAENSGGKLSLFIFPVARFPLDKSKSTHILLSSRLVSERASA